MHISGVIAGLLIAIGILSAMGLMIVGMVMYYVPGKLAQGQSLMGKGAGTALWTISLGVAVAIIIKGIEGSAHWEWKGVVHFVAIIAATLIVAWIARRYRKK